MHVRSLIVSTVALTFLATGCTHEESSPAPTGVSAPSTSTSTSTSTTTSGPSTRAYELGRHAIGDQAFDQFTGTGTPWQKACESVIDGWTASDTAQSWWNRDEVMKGCMDRANGPSESIPANTPAAQAGTPQQCASTGGNQIRITGGGISCADAYLLAARYDLQGEKYQKIDSIDTWTWFTGNADTRPLIFQCVSGTGAEFGVYPAP